MDAERLDRLDAAFGAAMREAMSGGGEGDLARLAEAMAGVPAEPGDLGGDWSCRWIKLGGVSPLVVYPPFRCRMAPAAGGWAIEKISGSQRFRGRIAPDPEGRWIYAGVAHVGAEPAVAYGDLPDEGLGPVEPNQTVAQVGIFEAVSPGRARLLLPLPVLESRFDVIELSR